MNKVPENIPEPLQGDPARQAPHLHRGIVFQDWRSVEAWVNLKEGEALYLEGAEDYDVVGATDGAAVQTRATAANISLRSDEVIESLLNYWKLQAAHPEKVITFRYVTTSGAAEEDKSPLGEGNKGLELWETSFASADHGLAEQLRAFLTEDEVVRPKLEGPPPKDGEKRPQTLLEFLESSSAQQVFDKIISRVRWDLRSEESEVVRESVAMRVNAHGRTFGMRPVDCAPALDRLFRVAAEAATKDEDRLLTRKDFLREFDDATQRLLSGPDRATQQAGADVMHEVLGGGTQSTGLLLEAAALIQLGVPEVGTPVVPRAELVSRLTRLAAKDHVLVLQGSSGMGKTKAARLVARGIGGDWVWADFQGVKAANLTAIVRLLAANLGQDAVRNVALDNLNYSGAELQAIDSQLAAIVRVTRLRGGKVIVTTQRELSARTLQKMRLTAADVVKIPRLTEKEVTEFCTLLGCPSALAKSHGKVVSLVTSGHPQLVHARLAGLAQSDWPAVTAADLATNVREIGEEKEVARQLLDYAPAGDKELVFRLSLTTGPFRREHAVAIAQLGPALDYGADAFGRLTGPWIETVGAGYFRLSPLLSHAATENWAPDKIREMRKGIARAFLKGTNNSLREADEVLSQGFAAEDADVIGVVAAQLAMAPMNSRDAVADALFWLPFIGRKGGERAVKTNAFVNFLIRMTQFKIGAKSDRKTANEFCAIVDREYAEDTAQKARGLDSTKHRLLWLTSVLFEHEANVAPATLVSYWREVLELLPGDPDLSKRAERFRIRSKKIPHLTETDFPAELLMMVTARTMTPSELVEFATAVNALPPDRREQALKALRLLLFPLRLAVDRAWSNEEGKKSTDWSKVVEALEAFQQAVSGWGIPSLDVYIRRAIAAVEDEHRNNPARALEVLTIDASAQEANTLLRDQRAMVLNRKEDYAGALAIWSEIIPTWTVQKGSPDLIPIYACQRATHASGRLKQWPQAIEYCRHGQRLAAALKDPHYGVTFRGDEAFARWKNGDRPGALVLLRTALEGFETLSEDPDLPLRLHMARKMFEQVVKWCRSEMGIREEETYEPPAGICSRIDVNEEIRQYPVAPFDLVWLQLTEIEGALHADRSIYTKTKARIAHSKYSVFRSLMAGVVLKEELHTRSLAQLARSAVAVVNTMAETKAQRAAGKTILMPDAYPKFAYPDPTWIVVQAAICGMIVQASTGNPLDEFLSDWEADAKTMARYPGVAAGLAEIRKTLALSESEAYREYRTQGRPSSARFTAAVRMSTEDGFDLDAMFVGHAALFTYLHQIALKADVEFAFGELVKKRWRERLRLPAQFQMPRLTVPAIKAACDDSATGVRLAARILLPAKDAVPSTPPPEIVQAWEKARS